MKQNYKAFAPDISTGGTTIKDVGKQRFSRKSANLSKLWELLICLMAIVMPVGAWAQGDGTSSNPYSGPIGYVDITNSTPTEKDGAIHIYLNGVTSEFKTLPQQTHNSISRFDINTDNAVVFHVAGTNTLQAWHATVSDKNHRSPALYVRNAQSITIVPWTEKIQDNSIPVIRFNADGSNAALQTPYSGIQLNNSQFTIKGAVAVLSVGGSDLLAGSQEAPAVDMKGTSVTLEDGAYFSIHGDYQDSNLMPSKWEITNFASAGRHAYLAIEQLENTGGTNFTSTNVIVPSKFQTDINPTGTTSETTFLQGYFNNTKFTIPSRQIRDNQDNELDDKSYDFKFFVNNNTTECYYGEFTTGTLDVTYPFPIRYADGNIAKSTKVGAAAIGDNYVGYLKEITSGTYTLNVNKYPHSGELTASNGNITLKGDDSYKMLAAKDKEFTLKGTENFYLKLADITIPAGNTVNIAGDVRVENCTIMQDVTKFNNESVYYCTISYQNTDLAKVTDVNDITVTNNQSYPYKIDHDYYLIHIWLPNDASKVTDVTFKASNSGNTYSLSEIEPKHGKQYFFASPAIKIDSKNYNTLTEAFNDVKHGETIEFTNNYSAIDRKGVTPPNIKKGETFYMDLGGNTFTINSKGDTENNELPFIDAGKGTLILKATTAQSGQTGTITGNYQIKGKVYSEINITGAHIGHIPVMKQIASTDITKTNNLPSYITYKIGEQSVEAVQNINTTNEYCLWLPDGNKDTYPVSDPDGTIFAQIKGTRIEPLFDLNSYSIEVGTSGVTYGKESSVYTATNYGTQQIPAEIVTVAEDNYNTENILTVNDGTYVILKDIYKGLQTGDGEDIATKLAVASGTANIQTSGINSIGTITIASGATLNFSQLEETPTTANALRFATINDKDNPNGTLNVQSGTLLAYLNEKTDDQIHVATATYTEGSVRAKFANSARFTDLYRVSFKVKEFYTPYDYAYPVESTPTHTGKVTSDKNGEIHLWLPQGPGGKARFNSAQLGSPAEEIEYSAVADNDDNIAPANIGLYKGTEMTPGTKIKSFLTLDAAFKEINASVDKDANYIIGVLAPHSESNTTCNVGDKKVTIDLNGKTLECHNVTFETNGNNFMLITNNATSTNTDAKHSSISGEITVSQNVYIGQNVHMEDIHVDMINPNSQTEPYKNVRRLLVKGVIFEKEYTYEFADQTVGFTVGQKLDESDEKTGVACLWLVESMYPQEFVVYGEEENAKNGLTVPGGELAIVAHSNGYTQLQPGGVVAEVDDKKYRTLSKAIEAANDPTATNSDIKLLADIQSQATFNITQSYAIDLNGHDLTFTQGGFNVTNGYNLIIKDESNDKGILAGVIKLINKDNVSVDPSVTIGGVVVDASQATPVNIYRLMVDGGADASLNTWVETPERDTDKQYGTTYEYTIPAGLANHSTTVKGYKVVTVDVSTDFEAVKNCNVIVPGNITWSATGTGYIHRLTIKAGGMVNAGDGTKITATDGIRYVRTFDANMWSLIALPFTATDITTVDKTSNKVISISPAADPGTSGHFWLHTIKNDGSTTDVTDSEMTANKVYVMKVPNSLLNQEITFVSGPNQMLRRDKVLAPNPISGFVAYANGTLNEVSMDDKKYYYTLDEVDGEQMFVRKEGASSKIAPFSGYLLADAATTKAVARFSLRSTPTANEEIEIAEDELQIRTEAGRIILTTETPVQVVICDLKGTVKFSGEIPAGDSSYEVGAGIYIINNQKVIVK